MISLPKNNLGFGKILWESIHSSTILDTLCGKPFLMLQIAEKYKQSMRGQFGFWLFLDIRKMVQEDHRDRDWYSQTGNGNGRYGYPISWNMMTLHEWCERIWSKDSWIPKFDHRTCVRKSCWSSLDWRIYCYVQRPDGPQILMWLFHAMCPLTSTNPNYLCD